MFSLEVSYCPLPILTHLFAATVDSLSATLFPSLAPPPFLSFTVLMLELCSSPFLQRRDGDHDDGRFAPVVRRIELPTPMEDSEAETFASPRSEEGGGEKVVVSGFLLCFPNYSTFLSKPGLYIEDIFVRAAWRRNGLGRMKLAAVAGEATRLGMGRMEWCILDWNVNAIKFYEEMGAEVLPMWRICRLTGDSCTAKGGSDARERSNGRGCWESYYRVLL